ncbi:selenoprotein t [Nannochloropsis oceanica]
MADAAKVEEREGFPGQVPAPATQLPPHQQEEQATGVKPQEPLPVNFLRWPLVVLLFSRQKLSSTPAHSGAVLYKLRLPGELCAAFKSDPEQTFVIHGENYPPPPYAIFLATIMSYVQVAVFMLMVTGRVVFRLLGAEPPAWFENMMNNKIQTFAIILLGNTAAASLAATGAFEITYFGPPVGGREGGREGGMVAHLVFSKLATGGMPNGHEILRRLRELGVE